MKGAFLDESHSFYKAILVRTNFSRNLLNEKKEEYLSTNSDIFWAHHYKVFFNNLKDEFKDKSQGAFWWLKLVEYPDLMLYYD